tara:strand:+ start:1181 stop:1432 length:252 start_codon:yes stop_codon:yes gene_type:complete
MHKYIQPENAMRYESQDLENIQDDIRTDILNFLMELLPGHFTINDVHFLNSKIFDLIYDEWFRYENESHKKSLNEADKRESGM